MKRHALISHLKACNCQLLREGSRHSIWICLNTNETSAVPRHAEIVDDLARKICKDLGIDDIKLK
ncbi:MAG: addiction module toxin, HicA family [Armatimonadetes bacterium]|nr:addiction module toxin, HicA family [Armatimonadota bacterium]